MCDDHSKCVDRAKLCDSVPDCFDHSDEFFATCDGMFSIYTLRQTTSNHGRSKLVGRA